MDTKEFIGLVQKRYLKNAGRLEDFSEKRFQLEIADELLNNNIRAFMEYPYQNYELW